MSNIERKLDDIQQKTENVTQSGVNDIIKNLNIISSAPNSQIQANATGIQQKVIQSLPNMLQTLDRTAKNGNQKLTVQYADALQKFSRKMRPLLSQNQISQINQQVKSSIGVVMENEQAQLQQNALKQVINQNINKQQPQIINVNVQQPNSINRPYKTIQEQIKPYKNIISQQLVAASGSNIPRSVQLLDKYAVSNGYLPMGTISQNKGRSYIGRYNVKSGNTQLTFAYPKNTVQSSSTPDITNTFRYHANKTINAWNQFVKQQNHMVSFINKVSTPQLRQIYVEKKIEQMSMATFYCRSLATLVYYYVQIPIQQFVRYRGESDYDGSKQSFEKYYSVGTQISKNPFLLKNEEGLLIYKALISKGQPSTVYQNIANIIKKLQNTLNKQNIKQYFQYVSNLTAEAKTYFSNIGLKQNQYRQTLQSPVITGIKTKQFIIPNGLQNTEILQIVKKVNNKEKDKQIKLWNLAWGDDTMMCYDYVWQFSL